MNALILVAFAALTATVTAFPHGYDVHGYHGALHGAAHIVNPHALSPVGPSGIVTGYGASGPSGVVTGAGAIGPSGIVTGKGPIGPTGPATGHGGHAAIVVAAPVVAAPVAVAHAGLGLGHGAWGVAGHGAWGGYGHGHGHGW
ncbi:hypothetical protein NQ318_007968 [Aromia moschata]|uniref:Uncharacterized protein n=1 Tax=Aromia moschata TaxID=1265417 RepID=A0AAV8YC73_9CUCU|nr:hypothetical protein NQ318_007968 [Aromia moschata]